jgi:hypothetical protein
VDDAVSTSNSALAARLAELESQVVAQQAAFEAEREQRITVEAERDRLREAYEALKIQVELAHRRLVIAKAERVDTTQLELDFAATLAELDRLAGLHPMPADLPGDGDGSKPTGDGPRRKGGGWRALDEGARHLVEPVAELGADRRQGLPEERLERVLAIEDLGGQAVSGHGASVIPKRRAANRRVLRRDPRGAPGATLR